MLEHAIEHKDNLIKLKRNIFNDEKFKYYIAASYMREDDISIKFDTWNSMHMVSVDRTSEIIGEMKYSICRDTLTCYGLTAINYGKSDDNANKLIFGMDLKRFISEIFEVYKFNKLNWDVVVGNPAEKKYDKLIERVNGRIVGVKKNDIKLIGNILCDMKMYEVSKEDYLNRHITSKDKWKGNNIIINGKEEWIFESNGELVSENVWCKCGHCGKEPTPEDYDGCLGELAGVMNACCGHGIVKDAYVQLIGGECIQGKDAIIMLDILKKHKES